MLQFIWTEPDEQSHPRQLQDSIHSISISFQEQDLQPPTNYRSTPTMLLHTSILPIALALFSLPTTNAQGDFNPHFIDLSFSRLSNCSSLFPEKPSQEFVMNHTAECIPFKGGAIGSANPVLNFTGATQRLDLYEDVGCKTNRTFTFYNSGSGEESADGKCRNHPRYREGGRFKAYTYITYR
ncbi:hypothetical protein K402DRAFT_184055 [Aulographum hederae CBS 113979]|uniref:Uncharacterized protein n=1 Tax=Aulographum hederae CBS 113979 TaxID=1176131 RepID=A0A6G1GQ50_9PEZI|nr:hypothetical protein K402DRAFT_184055 [Aulographum hederae CBS 113979]